MDINSIKTKIKHHKYITLKQKDNTSPIELYLCGSDGRPLTGLNGTATVTLLDLKDRQVRATITGNVESGLLTFVVTQNLKANKHSVEVTIGGKKFPSDGEFFIQVTQSHDQIEIDIIADMTKESALATLQQNILDYMIAHPEIFKGEPGISPNIPDNLVYTTPSNNLFNKDDVRLGYYANYQTGVESISANFAVSNFIKVESSTTYSKSDATQQVAFYDINKAFVGGVSSGATFTTGPSTQFIKVSTNKTNLPTFMMNKGSTLLPYEDFKALISRNDLSKLNSISLSEIQKVSSVTKADIDTLPVLAKQIIPSDKSMIYATPSKNLFNKLTVIKNSYVDYLNGTVKPLTAFNASDYIKVDASTVYTKNDNQQLAFYDTNKVYISGLASSTTFTTPENAAYLRLSVKDAVIDTLQLEKSSSATAYEPYGSYEIDRAKLNMALSDSSNVLKVLLPKKITIYKGMQFDIYFDGILKYYQAFKQGNYYITSQLVKSDGTYDVLKGKMLNNKWFYKPSTLETFKLEFRVVKNFTEDVIATHVVDFNVVDKPVGKTIDIVTLGDSFTDGYGITTKLSDLMDADGVLYNFMGLHKSGVGDTGKTGVFDDAWSGYSYEWYVNNSYGYKRADRVDEGTGSTSNQFFNKTTGKFDFSYYMSTYQNNHNVDAVIINLGLNDVQTKTISEVKLGMDRSKNNVKAIIDSIKAYDSTIKIFLWLVPKQNEKNDYISTYSKSFNHFERLNHNVELFNEMLLSFEDNVNVFVNATNANFDKENSYLTKTEVTNQITNANDTTVSDIHPNSTGVEYLARTIYQNLSNAY